VGKQRGLEEKRRSDGFEKKEKQKRHELEVLLRLTSKLKRASCAQVSQQREREEAEDESAGASELLIKASYTSSLRPLSFSQQREREEAEDESAESDS
jgi:hypothetical protein